MLEHDLDLVTSSSTGSPSTTMRIFESVAARVAGEQASAASRSSR